MSETKIRKYPRGSRVSVARQGYGVALESQQSGRFVGVELDQGTRTGWRWVTVHHSDLRPE